MKRANEIGGRISRVWVPRLQADKKISFDGFLMNRGITRQIVEDVDGDFGNLAICGQAFSFPQLCRW